MTQLGVALLLAITVVGSFAGGERIVYPTFHLLNPGPDSNMTGGLLLASINNNTEIGVPLVDSNLACYSMGYRDGMYTQYDAREISLFNNTELNQFDVVVTGYYNSDNETRYFYNGTEAAMYCTEYSDTECYYTTPLVWLICGGSADPTPEPTPEPSQQVSFVLASFDSEGNLQTDRPEGVVIALVGDGDPENVTVGSVCDDNVNFNAADIICKTKGYLGAIDYGNVRNYTAYRNEWNAVVNDQNIEIVIDQLNCPNGTDNFVEDCSYTLHEHDCSHDEDLVVICDAGDSNSTADYEIFMSGIFRQDAADSSPRRSNEGLVVLGVVNTRTGQEHFGTVCDDGMNMDNAHVACRALGFDYAYMWNNRENRTYMSEDIVNELEIVMDGISCPGGAVDIDECTYDLMSHDCSHSEDVILGCHGEGNSTSPSPRPTEYPTSFPTGESDLDDEVAVKFGGLELKMKLSPKQGRARVIDVIEGIGWFFG